jgi:hypothetical protein
MFYLTTLYSVNKLNENGGVGNDVEGSDLGLFRKVIFRNSPGETENYHEISQQRDAVSRPRFELDIFRIRVRSSSA